MARAYGLLFVLFAVTTGAKTYYLGAAYVYLLAAGAVAIDAWLQARPGRPRNLLLASALTTAVTVLIRQAADHREPSGSRKAPQANNS